MNMKVQNPKSKIQSLRNGGASVLASLLVLATVLWPLISVRALTPFYYQGFLANGAPQTNTIYVSQYPANATQFSIYGTNIIFGGNVTNFTPTATGFATNALFPGQYKFYVTNLNASFLVNIPDTLLTNSLALYLENPATVSSGAGLSGFQIITNLMGMIPANAANTNDFARATLAGITNALAMIPANAANTNDFARATLAGITNALAMIPANAANTNDFARATVAGITNALAMIPANAANTNDFARASANGLSLAIGSRTDVKVITNGATVIFSYNTNGVPGSAFTNYPQGSLLVTTNGQLFQLTNLVWIAK